jgi:glutathione S-transferase
MALNDRLQGASHLFGDRPALADMAIAPFVRQFGQTDAEWFALQPWPMLRRWLDGLTQGALWAQAMRKYATWKVGEPGVAFPD